MVWRKVALGLEGLSSSWSIEWEQIIQAAEKQSDVQNNG